MEDSVLSFLKAEWKVSDTGSDHWASSIIIKWGLILLWSYGSLSYIYLWKSMHITTQVCEFRLQLMVRCTW
jgi:hypothetical protein